MRLLLIEDDDDLGEAIAEALKSEGYQVQWERHGGEGLFRALEWDWDAVVLDWLLPGEDGMAVLRQLRQAKSTPVLMLTALNTVQHRLEGFDNGADDYLGKPFDLSELLARVRALLRRAYRLDGDVIRCGELELQTSGGRVFRGSREIRLSGAEYRALEHLMLRKGRVVSRHRLEELLDDDLGDVLANTLDVHMHRLRSKIGADVIQTRRGLGYLVGDDA